MMNHFLLKTTATMLLVLAFITVNAQHKKVAIDKSVAETKKLDINSVKSTINVQELSGEANIDETSTKWNRSLINFEKRHKLPSEIQKLIDEKTNLKLQHLKENYPDEAQLKDVFSSPSIGTNFEGNWFDGMTPPDNSMAISNGGYIVTIVNSNIEYYNTSGTFLYTSSFDDFFNDPSLTSMIYDPVVIYDSGADRFFMVVLHGISSSTSKVLTCFSKTNNPMNGWWVYYLSGNPLNDVSWFDYPKIGVSNNEVYVTGNLYYNTGNNNQSVIYQMDKNDGYAGNSLTWSYWYNISEDPFTLVPASYGLQGNYGPGIYLISTDENDIYTDKYRLYDLTDDLSGTPQIDVYSVDADFSLAGNALQYGTAILLDNGTNRGLKAFYLNGILHFVFHSEYANAYNGINYNRLTLSTLTNWNSVFGLDGYDYSYPSVASFGTSQYDKSVMICFLRSGSSIYPQVRVVSCDNYGNWTGSSLVKAGETFVDVYQSGGVTRWGDYSGISRKQNASSPEVWLSGCFGKYRSGEHAYDTWIAQINGITTGISDNINPTNKNIRVFPNPVYEMFNVEFNLDTKMNILISLTDINGKIVKLLYNDIAKKGDNSFSFNKGALTSGIYFLTIKTNSKTIKNEKIIIK